MGTGRSCRGFRARPRNRASFKTLIGAPGITGSIAGANVRVVKSAYGAALGGVGCNVRAKVGCRYRQFCSR